MGRVYFVNGFLGAGKTRFIQELLEEDYFKIKGKTLLLLCEEGETEYDDYLMQNLNVEIKKIENEEDFTPDNLTNIEKESNPERIIIEFNGMWMRKDLEFPWYWNDIMEIAIFDTPSFDMYARNMKSLLSEQVRNAYMAVFFSADGFKDKLATYRRNVKAVNPKLNIVFKDRDGDDIVTRFEDELPYDLNAPLIDITDDAFAAFYLDSLDNIDRYIGKRVRFTAQVMKTKDQTRKAFLAGRMALTCCEQDLSLFGVICDYDQIDELIHGSWAVIEGTLSKEFFSKYENEFLICKVEDIQICGKPKKEIIDVI
ncbi:MAG: GTPase [Butyrivibrio sp.]|nr:GTPase [Butyrivibrio sp.]